MANSFTVSRETVRIIAKTFDPQAIASARFGPRVGKKIYGLFGSSRPTDAPLQRVYMDNTQLDVYVTDEDGLVVLVRPWITVATDDYTSMPVGYALSMMHPKEEQILEALRNAILPKSPAPGLDSSIFVWEAFGIPDEIVIDNGLDLQAHGVSAACLSVGMEVGSTPPNEAWHKGRIERFFKTGDIWGQFIRTTSVQL